MQLVLARCVDTVCARLAVALPAGLAIQKGLPLGVLLIAPVALVLPQIGAALQSFLQLLQPRTLPALRASVFRIAGAACLAALVFGAGSADDLVAALGAENLR